MKGHIFAITALAVVLILSGPASAADIYVNSTGGSDDNDGLSWAAAKATIRNATLSASSGDSIFLADGEYTGDDNRDITIDRNLSITGQSNNGTVIDCEALGRAFSVGDVSFTLRNITVKHGTGNWGGVIHNTGNLTVDGCRFIDNRGDYGAVITNYGSSMTYPTATIKNSHFENNTVNMGTSGGALYNEFYATMIVDSCTFINNRAFNMGGAVYSYYGGNLTVINSTFLRNSAATSGGAIHSEHGSADIINCTFAENTAYNGGAILNWASLPDSGMKVVSSTFTSNRAGNSGGGIHSAGDLSVTDSTFHDSEAALFGGALYLSKLSDGDRVEIEASSFTSSSSRYGGAIYAVSTSGNMPVSVNRCTLQANSAWYGGGATFSGVNATVTGCSFTENVASEHAGGIRNDYGELKVRNSTFTDNRAYYGAGAIGSLHAVLADISGCTFTGNIAETWHLGSAVLSYFTDTRINFCRIINNPDADVYCEDGQSVDARYNWWGSNSPDFTELTAGDVTSTPWIILTVTADPSSVRTGGTSLIRADLLHDSEGVLHSTPVPYNGPADFHSSAGSIDDASMVLGSATSTLRNLNTPGTVRVFAALDNQVVSTTVNVTAPSSGITIKQLAAAAAWVRNYYARHRTLPAGVRIGAVNYSMAQFLDLLVRGTVQINSGNLNPLKPRAVGYGGSTGIHSNGRLYRSAYVNLAVTIRNFINTSGRAPRYALTGYGRVSFVKLLYCYSNIIGFYGSNGRLPRYVLI